MVDFGGCCGGFFVLERVGGVALLSVGAGDSGVDQWVTSCIMYIGGFGLCRVWSGLHPCCLMFDAVILCVSWPVAYFVAAMSTVGG